jgi:hypothetical protein
VTTMSHHLKTADGSPSWQMFAALGTGLAAVLTAIGTFSDITGNDAGDNGFADYWPVLAIIAVGAIVTFGLVTRISHPMLGLALGVLAVASLAVFWSGLPCVFAAGALSVSWSRRSETTSLIASGLSAVAIVGAVLFAISG